MSKMIQNVTFAGNHPSATRCYCLSINDKITHLKSTGQFQNLKTIRETAERFCRHTPLAQEDVALFIFQNHLPPDLSSQLTSIEGFKEFCKIIAFCSNIYLLGTNEYASEFALPSSYKDHPDARAMIYPGFSVPKPAEEIDFGVAHSFGKDELKAFLGEFFDYAGEMIFLNLRDSEGRYFTLLELRDSIACLTRFLIPPS